MATGGHGFKTISCPSAQRIYESNPPDGKKRLDISHNQPGIRFFEISVICNLCKQSECVALCIHDARTVAAMEAAVAVIIRTQACKADHLIVILTAAAVMMMFLRFLTVIITLVLTSAVAMIVMDVVA